MVTAALQRQVIPVCASTLEVRWILPGQLDPAVADWFARFPAWTETRQDSYLVQPRLPGLAVNIRGGGPLEVKIYLGSPGLLHAWGGVGGRMERWRKWSLPPGRFPFGSPRLPGWTAVRKSRKISWFPSASQPGPSTGPVRSDEQGCAVELTEIHAAGQPWWSLGFEATGPSGLQRSQLDAAAAQVFAEPLPEGAELGAGNSQSYAKWLATLARRGT